MTWQQCVVYLCSSAKSFNFIYMFALHNSCNTFWVDKPLMMGILQDYISLFATIRLSNPLKMHTLITRFMHQLPIPCKSRVKTYIVISLSLISVNSRPLLHFRFSFSIYLLFLHKYIVPVFIKLLDPVWNNLWPK